MLKGRPQWRDLSKLSSLKADRPLKIAQIAPLYESVPPKLYGGTERVVSFLTDELVRRGHDVTLFAAGDSTTKAKLRPGWRVALRLAGLNRLGPSYQLITLSDVFDHAEEFDIIHSHIDYWSFPFARLTRTPVLSTAHGRLDIPELFPIFDYYRDMPQVSISDAQRMPLPQLNWVATIYHGLPPDLLKFSPGPGKYLAFLGRISPEKRPDLAIEIARRSGVPLKIAAKVDAVDKDYYEAIIKPLIVASEVEYIGEIDDSEKSEFLGQALALLFPIDWPEPFGLTMIESLACGTPVVARPCGSVPEILRDGVTGFLASEIDELAGAVKRIENLSRRACRQEFETRFSVGVMAERYERLYRELRAAAAAELFAAGEPEGREPALKPTA